MNSPSSETSSWLRPPAGSSRRRRRGLATSARASSTRFCVPYGRAAAGKSARSRSPTTSRTSSASASATFRPRPCAPTSTFSRIDIVRKSWMFWNVRATPLRTILNAGCFRSDEPSSRTSPESGRYRWVMTLNAVVLPAPFGPIRPEIFPSSTSKELPSRATMPPKRSVTSRTSSRAIGTDPKRVYEPTATKELTNDQLVPVDRVARRPDAHPRAGGCGDVDGEEAVLVRPARAADPARVVVLLEPHPVWLLPGTGPNLTPQAQVASATRRLHQREAESGVGGLLRPVLRDEPALPAGRIGVVANHEADQHRARGRLVHAHRRARHVRRLLLRRHAEVDVGRIRLVPVLGEPDGLVPERLRDLPLEPLEVGHRDRLAVHALRPPWGLALRPARIRIVRVGVELRVRVSHRTDPRDGRDAGGPCPRSGDAARHLRTGDRSVELGVGGIEKRLDVR